MGARQLRAKALRRRAPGSFVENDQYRSGILWVFATLHLSYMYESYVCMNDMWYPLAVTLQKAHVISMWYPHISLIHVNHSYMYIIHTRTTHEGTLQKAHVVSMWYLFTVIYVWMIYMYELYTCMNDIYVMCLDITCMNGSYLYISLLLCTSHIWIGYMHTCKW